MGATIEAVELIQHPETATQRGVVCIFCGLPTPVRTSYAGTLPTEPPRPNIRIAIVRCESCGKEAPYPVHEISEFEELDRAPTAILWFAKDAT